MKLQFKKLPIATILIATIFAIGLILFIGTYAKKSAFSQITSLGGREITIEDQNRDSDNDGLKDWEENLYKTDSLNPDTDVDGYLDGEEINSGHNPLIKGPNDMQAFYPLPIGDKYNITDKIFADLGAVVESYVQQKNQYAQDHPEIMSSEEYLAQVSDSTLTEMIRRALIYNEEDWAAQAAEILEALPEVFKIEISDSDIKTSENNNYETLKAYAENLLLYLNSGDFLLQDQNLTSLKDALSGGDLLQIDELILANDDEIAKLVDTPVPSSWKNVHKKTLKIAIITRNIFVALRGYESDPIKAIVGANEIENVLPLWNELTAEIINLNKVQGLNLSL